MRSVQFSILQMNNQRVEQMASKSVRIRVLNSLLVIRDELSQELPDIDRNGAVWSTASCVLVTCMPDCDGETHVTLGGVNEVGQDGTLIFDRRLETPSKRIVIDGVMEEKILQTDVPTSKTRMRIWTNGLRDTDIVTIGLG
jgi:hypothetical protein